MLREFLNVGIDQTRGWFYTLMVLSTALFEKPAFKSLVCNGLILAEDGKKMSKRLRNYPVSSLIPACLTANVLDALSMSALAILQKRLS